MTLHIEERTTKQEIITGFTCNRCKKLVESDDTIEMQERFQYTDTGGYGSVFGDGIRFRIDLCQQCFKQLLGKYVEYLN